MGWTKAQQEYAHSQKGKEARKRYQASEKGKAAHSRYLEKRRQKLEQKAIEMVDKIGNLEKQK